MNETRQKGITLLVIVAALGYFVDVFDLLLFGYANILTINTRNAGYPVNQETPVFGRVIQ